MLWLHCSWRTCYVLSAGKGQQVKAWSLSLSVVLTVKMYDYMINISCVCVCFRTSSRDVLRDETTSGSFKQTSMYTRSDGEWSPIQRCFIHSHDEDPHYYSDKTALLTVVCFLFLSQPWKLSSHLSQEWLWTDDQAVRRRKSESGHALGVGRAATGCHGN